ncbi:hypothetical protein Barb4_03335 [Bacteroidales bacterium Barb4]|nr:hypothetical protein Barb4_03335 [Bacteroidales bacterium Barb4]
MRISSTEGEAYNTSIRIAERGEVFFIKRPVYRNSEYHSSKVLADNSQYYYNPNSGIRPLNKRLDDYPEELDFDMISNSLSVSDKTGYCIRTGKRITFNQKRPFCLTAFKEWKTSGGNENEKEKYCHFSGELSNGETSFRYPFLRKYWPKANAKQKEMYPIK